MEITDTDCRQQSHIKKQRYSGAGRDCSEQILNAESALQVQAEITDRTDNLQFFLVITCALKLHSACVNCKFAHSDVYIKKLIARY